MFAKKHTILIAGASGVVGKAATEHSMHHWLERMQIENCCPADPPYDLQEYP